MSKWSITTEEEMIGSITNGVRAPLPLIDLDKISEIIADTYDRITPVYTEEHFDDFVLTQPLDAFARLLREQGMHRVLDIGCGPGSEVGFLAARGFEVVGIDASSKMVGMARSRVHLGEFHHMKMQDLQFPETCFDAIWSARTLIHVPSEFLVDLLAAWKRVLSPKGVLGVGVIIGAREGWGPEDYAPDLPMFNRYFEEGEMESALKRSGYTILDSLIVQDERDPDNPNNLFVLAQRSTTTIERESFYHYVRYDKVKGVSSVEPDDLESVINIFLGAGSLTSRECVNLCVLYDKLAKRDKTDEKRFKLAAHKLKLHLQTPDTLSAPDDFDIWFTLGRLHLKLSQFKQAISCLEMAHKLRLNHFATLARLGYSHEGLREFDKAIRVASEAERLAAQNPVSDEEMADLYHALGHFYVGYSYIGREEGDVRVDYQELGEEYMKRACKTGKQGYGYLSCLGGIYTETKRYSEAVRLFDQAISDEKVQQDLELYNEIHFYRGEAYMYMGKDPYYDRALADFDHVEQYARARRDQDALAHVKLYKVRTELMRKDVAELELGDLRSYLEELYQYEPSIYVVESFRSDRERLISILSAFYLLRQCMSSPPPSNFEQCLKDAIDYMEKMYREERNPDLNLLVLSDDHSLPKDLYKYPYLNPRLYHFDEVGTELRDPNERFRVWSVFALKGDSPPSVMNSVTYLVGRFYERGHTIYIYDPHRVFPNYIRESKEEFFIDTIDGLGRYSYVSLLYEKARGYLSSPKTPLGMAPINVAPSLLATQAEVLELLPIDALDDR